MQQNCALEKQRERHTHTCTDAHCPCMCVSDVLECARQDAKVAEQALAGVQQCSTSSTAGLPQALWRCQIPHTKTRLPLKNDMTS